MAAKLGMSKGVPVSRAAEETLEAREMLDGIEYKANRMMMNEGRLKTMTPAMENDELINIYADAINGIHFNNFTVTRAANTALENMYRVTL